MTLFTKAILMPVRNLTPLDHVLAQAQRALVTVASAPRARQSYPAMNLAEAELNDKQRRHAAGLMRVNHTGEVCAQALYDGQAALTRDTENRVWLQHAADEETDHLAWCTKRLKELHSRPSLLNPLWYASSYAIGVMAALAGDAVSLGFVVETERQVEAHLDEHLHRLPAADQRSRAVVQRMKADEARHAQNALARGSTPLPFPVARLMHAGSLLMKTVAYYL